MTLPKVLSLVFSFIALSAHAADPKPAFSCTSDFSALREGYSFVVSVSSEKDGIASANLRLRDDKGALSPAVNFENIKVRHYSIDYVVDVENDDINKTNPAERMVSIIHAYLNDPATKSHVHYSFDIDKARSMKIYRFEESSWGPTALYEVYDQKDKLLGRLFMSVLAAECK